MVNEPSVFEPLKYYCISAEAGVNALGNVATFYYAHTCMLNLIESAPGRVAQSVGHLTRKSGVLGSIPGLATYFRFSFRFFKKGSCQLLAKICA